MEWEIRATDGYLIPNRSYVPVEWQVRKHHETDHLQIC